MHRQMQVIFLPGKHRVRLHIHLNIQVTGRAATVPHLALAGHAHPHCIANARRDLNNLIPARFHPTCTIAAGARVGNDFPVAAAGRAGAGGHDVTEEGTLHLLHLPHAAAMGAGFRLLLGFAAGSLAGFAHHGGVNGDLLLHPGVGLLQGDGGAQQGIVAGLDAAAGPAGARPTTEEGIKNVGESTETTHAAGGTARTCERVPTHVDNAAFFGVEEEFLGDGDFAKFFGRFLGAIDVRMVFAGQPTVRFFNIVVGRVWG